MTWETTCAAKEFEPCRGEVSERRSEGVPASFVDHLICVLQVNLYNTIVSPILAFHCNFRRPLYNDQSIMVEVSLLVFLPRC